MSGSHERVQAAIREVQRAVRDAKKRLVEAEQSFRALPPEILNRNQWLWGYRLPLEDVGIHLKRAGLSLEQAIAVGEAGPRQAEAIENPIVCACGHALAEHEGLRRPCLGLTSTGSLCPCVVFDPKVSAPVCGVCGLPKITKDMGQSCVNGHGNAPPVECKNVKPGDIDCGSADCELCFRAYLERERLRAGRDAVDESERRKKWKARVVPKDY